MRVKCNYKDLDGDLCKHRGSDGYCTLEEIEVNSEGTVIRNCAYACCQEEDVELTQEAGKRLRLLVVVWLVAVLALAVVLCVVEGINHGVLGMIPYAVFVLAMAGVSICVMYS